MKRTPLTTSRVSLPVEIVGNADFAPDPVAAWLSLDMEQVSADHGAHLFDLGVPCQRKMYREAVKRHVFVDGFAQVGGDDTAWDSPLVDGPIALDENYINGAEAKVVEREVEPARYNYWAPRVLATLPPQLARWVYETFQAAEIDSMHRLRDAAVPWSQYVGEMRDGRENSQ